MKATTKTLPALLLTAMLFLGGCEMTRSVTRQTHYDGEGRPTAQVVTEHNDAPLDAAQKAANVANTIQDIRLKQRELRRR